MKSSFRGKHYPEFIILVYFFRNVFIEERQYIAWSRLPLNLIWMVPSCMHPIAIMRFMVTKLAWIHAFSLLHSTPFTHRSLLTVTDVFPVSGKCTLTIWYTCGRDSLQFLLPRETTGLHGMRSANSTRSCHIFFPKCSSQFILPTAACRSTHCSASSCCCQTSMLFSIWRLWNGISLQYKLASLITSEVKTFFLLRAPSHSFCSVFSLVVVFDLLTWRKSSHQQDTSPLSLTCWPLGWCHPAVTAGPHLHS